jgi:hypothetical protein
MQCKWVSTVTLIGAAALILAPSGRAAARPPKAGAPSLAQPAVLDASGVIRKVDASTGRVLLQRRQGAALLLFLENKTEILRNGQPAAAGDLQPGDRAGARYVLRGGRAYALRIEARATRKVRGLITAIDASGFITLRTPKGEAVTLQLSDATKIFLKRKPATFADLQLGMRAAAACEPGTTPPLARLLLAVPASAKTEPSDAELDEVE